jgi:hypothetical protein
MGYLLIFVRCLVGGVFALAGALKLTDRAGFAATVEALRLVPRRRVPAVVAATVAAELATAALCLPGSGVPGLVLGAALLAAFAAVAARARRMRVAVACRCFGGNGAPLGRPQIVRNLVIAAVAVAAAVAAAFGPGGGPLAGWGVALAVLAAAVVVTLVVFLDRITELVLPTGSGGLA